MDMILINTYSPNNRAPSYAQQKMTKLKGEIENSAITAGDFEPHTQWMEHQIHCQQGNRRLKHHYRSIRPDRHLHQ